MIIYVYQFSMFTSHQVEDYAKLLNAKQSTNMKAIPRFRPILQSLLVSALYQRDVVESMLKLLSLAVFDESNVFC